MAPGKIGLHPSIVVTRTMGTPRHKKYHVNDLFSSNMEFLVFTPSVDNTARAINERLFYVKMNGALQRPIQAQQDAVDSLEAFILDVFEVSERFAPYPREVIPELYKGRKRTIMENAVVDLRSKPLAKKDFRLQAFGKVENLKKSGKKFGDMVLRVIQTRGPRYNVELGRFLKKIEHTLYKDIDKMFTKFNKGPDDEITIMKGYNSEDSARILYLKWSRFRRPVCILFDAKRFDQHCGDKVMKVEHKMYVKYFPNRRHRNTLKWLLAGQLDNKGTAYCKDGKVKYHIGACRCSGDMNTGSGNCCIMCIVSLEFTQYLELQDFAFFNNGDDAGLIVEEEDVEKLLEHLDAFYRARGFIIEVEEPIRVFEQISFCQTQPVFDGDKYRMIRAPEAAASKDALSIHPFHSPKDWVAYLDSVGQGGLSMTGGIPMVQEYYSAMLRISKENMPSNYDVSKRKENQSSEKTGFWFMTRNMNEKYREPTEAARYSFFLAFNILPEIQIAMEQTYRSFSMSWRGPSVLGPVSYTQFS